MARRKWLLTMNDLLPGQYRMPSRNTYNLAILDDNGRVLSQENNVVRYKLKNNMLTYWTKTSAMRGGINHSEEAKTTVHLPVDYQLFVHTNEYIGEFPEAARAAWD